MAVQPHRNSSTRIKKRRGPANWNFKKNILNQPIIKCFNCQELKLRHRLCPHCLTYRKLDFSKSGWKEREIE